MRQQPRGLNMKDASRVFVSSLALALALAACDGPVTPEEPLDDAGLQARIAALAQNLETAEALRSVKRLQWAYGHYSEFGLWHDFADLFADTGIGHYVQGDLDREQIRALFLDQVGQGSLGLADGRIYPHISFSPVIDISEDGASARGRFRILAMLGGYGGNATWFHGVYENAYIKEQGVWKLNEISNTAQVTGNFTAGLSASATAPLDAPSFAFHYQPAQVGSVPMRTASGFATDIVATAGQPQSALDLLQQRSARLQDEAQIISLQHQYGYYLDAHAWDALLALFADDASFESGQQGVYIGKASIRRALEQYGASPLPAGEVDDHILFQTYVSVAADGLSARARVDQLGLHGRQGVSAQWSQGIYENTFVKQDGVWRIQSLHYYPRLITDYHKGWAADAQPAPVPSALDPPDAPATEEYALYPTFYIPPLHFLHPVTGRAPQYPPGDPASGNITFAGNSQPALFARKARDAAGVQELLATTETQVRRMLAVDAVENLVNAYGYYLDECMTREAAQLFAAQGENAIPGIGYYQGAERIAEALRLAYCPNGRQENAFTLRHVLQPVTSIDEAGDTATLTARLWQVHATGAGDDYYLMGQLQGAAVRQGQQWKLSSLDTVYHWAAAAEEGWADATVNAALGYAAPEQMLADYPPDRPTGTARLAPYPVP